MTPKDAMRAAEDALKSNDLQRAMELYQLILAKLPRHPGATKGVRKVEKLARAGLQVVRPEEFDKAVNLYQSGEIQKAERAVSDLLRRSPDLAALHNLRGLILSSSQRKTEAISCFKKSMALDANFLEAANNLGLLLAETGDLVRAVVVLSGVLADHPNQAHTHHNLGTVFERQEEYSSAETSFKAAIRLFPDFYEAWAELGKLLALQGHNERAISCLEKAIKINPERPEPYCVLARLKRLSPLDPVVHAMENLAENIPLTVIDRAAVSFALGKVFEESRDYSRSYHHYRRGNELQKTLAPYSEKSTRAEFAALKATAEIPAIPSQESDITPIFIVGMNRSGTTLVEQMLSSHSDISTRGELEAMSDIVMNLGWPGAEISQDEINAAAELYLGKLGEGGASGFIVDKMPINFKWIGLIRRMFPDAPIISMERDARDVCFSNYKASFTSEGHMYAYDAESLARYYVMYANLMTHWHDQFAASIHRLRYEDLISEPEAEMRKVLNYLNVSWQPEILEFHKSKRAVRTLSQSQVRQKITSSAVNAWKPYAEHLKPMFDILAKAEL